VEVGRHQRLERIRRLVREHGDAVRREHGGVRALAPERRDRRLENRLDRPEPPVDQDAELVLSGSAAEGGRRERGR
jgi:hypothetical protein